MNDHRFSAELFDQLRERRSIGNGAVALDDFNFRTPGADLLKTRTAEAFTALEHSDYPGEFVDKDRGGRLAQVRLESLACRNRAIELIGNIRTLAPGFTFQLSDHPAKRLNRKYLLTRVRHSALRPQGAEAGAAGGAADYRVEVEVLPADVPFRLRQDTPRPVVRGSQTAIVVGPKDEEIHTDKYGRIKVQFHWDRDRRFDESSSYWIRVSQGMAGAGYGMMFLPRVGQEVIVDFLEGNPDCPIITGRVYNNDHMPPYELPAEKTKSCIKTNSSKGGHGVNEIRFEDAKGKEHLLIHAQRSLHRRSRGNAYETVGCDRHVKVKRDKIETVERDKHVEVLRDQQEYIWGSMHYEVRMLNEYLLNHVQFVTDTYYLNCGGKAIIEAEQGITLRCGGNFITIDKDGVWISACHIGLNSGGMPLTHVADPIPDLGPAAKSARTTKPGHDVHYSGTNDDPNDDPNPNNGGKHDDPSEDDGHWIEIEMRDETGVPWAHEEYEIEEPGGTVHTGSLDDKGSAHVWVERAGECQIRFPKIDAAAWRRA
ncbi:MAG: type VI secretion system tip protein VgrG [Planctomycetes bacterium]|nr:type VI secretion system tip protein VgrG [Planctomycetota bacterium]